jgi:hypothetical protein
VAVKYRNIIAQEMDLSPISEKQLYKMVGKLRPFVLETRQQLLFSYFLSLGEDRVVSAEK